MERRIVRICRAGDQLPMPVSFILYPLSRVMPTLQNVQADAAELVDVWVVDLGKEADFGWCHGVVIRKEELELEGTACEMCISCRQCNSRSGYSSHSRMVTAKGRRW
jgi:hypothetical protein